jgi:hypothetical protein
MPVPYNCWFLISIGFEKYFQARQNRLLLLKLESMKGQGTRFTDDIVFIG